MTEFQNINIFIYYGSITPLDFFDNCLSNNICYVNDDNIYDTLSIGRILSFPLSLSRTKNPSTILIAAPLYDVLFRKLQ